MYAAFLKQLNEEDRQNMSASKRHVGFDEDLPHYKHEIYGNHGNRGSSLGRDRKMVSQRHSVPIIRYRQYSDMQRYVCFVISSLSFNCVLLICNCSESEMFLSRFLSYSSSKMFTVNTVEEKKR